MPPTATELWGDKDYADATVTMGDKVWHIHRWVVCRQSDYFLKAYEGKFKESKTKTIDLSGGDFSEKSIDSMLRFMYTHELDGRQKIDSLSMLVIADYFRIKNLHAVALYELQKILSNFVSGRHFINYKAWALRILQDHGGTDIEQALVTVTADNARAIINNDILPNTWNDIVQLHPFFANKVVLAMVSKPEAGQKRSAGAAFDDCHSSRPNSRARGSHSALY